MLTTFIRMADSAPPRSAQIRWTACFLGFVLIAASVAKGAQLLTDPFVDIRTHLPAVVLFLVVLVEFVCGLLFLVPSFSLALKGVFGLLLFSAFLVFAMLQWVQGSPSCGCLGAVTIPPWGAVVFDLLAIVICVYWTRTAARWRDAIDHEATRKLLANTVSVTVGMGIVLLPFVLWNSPRGHQAISRILRLTDISVEPLPVLTVPNGSSQFEFRITNVSRSPLTLLGSEVSCSCVKVKGSLAGTVMAPGTELAIPFTIRPNGRTFVRERIVLFVDSTQQRVTIPVRAKVQSVDPGFQARR